MVDFFIKTDYDIEFYNKHIKERIPEKIIDMHLHITKPIFTKNVINDPTSWTTYCTPYMDIDEYYDYSKIFYPDSNVYVNAIPCVTKNVDIIGNNKYLSEIKKEKRAAYIHMLTDPSWTSDFTEKILIDDDFNGFKPYPDYVTGIRGSDIGLFEFLTHDQWNVLNKHKKSMVLHLPREGRFPDDKNINELKTAREKYPDVKIIIAHCGRSYSMYFIEEAYKKLGSLMNEFYYDLAAVLNPDVINFMLKNVSHDKILYGTDLPVFLWHGKRRWTYTEYFNLIREDFKYNKHEESKEDEAKYTFFIYEQLKNILDAADNYGGVELSKKIFYKNAENLEGVVNYE